MKTFRLLFIFSAALLLAVSCTQEKEELSIDEANKKATFLSNERWSEIDFCNVSSHELIGGQTIVMGSVIIGRTEDSLYVKYQADPGYILTETHLFVGDVMSDDFPKNKKENPKIGHFPYATEDFGGSNIVMYSIGLDEITAKSNGCFDIAAHAVVQCEDGTCEETAWGAGEIENEVVFAAKAFFKVGETYPSGSTQGIIYADDCYWGSYFGYIILDLANFTPESDTLFNFAGDVGYGVIDVEIENDSLVFAFRGADENILLDHFLYVGDLNGLFSYSADTDCPEYRSFPYQGYNTVEKIALSDLPSESTTSGANEFLGDRWGFYIEYCASCN